MRPMHLIAGALSAPAFVFATTFGATAADSNGRFAIEGGGLQTCAAFLQAASDRSPDLGLYGSWMEGYVTALNQTRDGIYDLTPWQGAQALLAAAASTCRALPPETRFVTAANLIVDLLAPTALTRESRPLGVQNGERQTVIYTTVLERVKTALSEAGHPTDDPEGTFGQPTVDALSAYQAEQGLTETGLPDQITLARLLPVRIQGRETPTDN